MDSLPKAFTTGIYYGLSNVDNGKVYKTVLSIGWNPFYHNTKKSLVRLFVTLSLFVWPLF